MTTPYATVVLTALAAAVSTALAQEPPPSSFAGSVSITGIHTDLGATTPSASVNTATWIRA